MSKIIIFLSLFLLLVLQLTVMPHLTIFNVFPNILLVSILVLEIIKENQTILILAAAAGLALDLFSGLPFGINALGFVLTIWLMQFIGKNIFKITDLSGEISLVALACLAYSLLNVLLINFFRWLGFGSLNLFFWSSLTRLIIPEFILNTILASVILLLIKKTHGLFSRTWQGI